MKIEKCTSTRFKFGSATSPWSTTISPVNGESTSFPELLNKFGEQGMRWSHDTDNALDKSEEQLTRCLEIRHTLTSYWCILYFVA